MPYTARRPVVIVEGHGDIDAVGALFRKVAHHCNVFDLSPVSPAIRGGSIGKFRNVEQLGRFVRLAALRGDSDSIIIAVDCDDDCAKNEVIAMSKLLLPIAEEINKKVGICFFVKEFECLFLHCLDELSAKFTELQIQLPCPVAPHDIEKVRAAKGMLNRQMQNGTYKETRDQSRFVHALDIAKLIAQSRSTLHLMNCINFLRNDASPLVYP